MRDGDVGDLKIKRKKVEPQKILTYLFGVYLPLARIDDVPLFEGKRRMKNRIFPIPDLHYEMKGQVTLP